MKVIVFSFIALLIIGVAITLVQLWRDRLPWPRERHLGHWKKWDEDDD